MLSAARGVPSDSKYAMSGVTTAKTDPQRALSVVVVDPSCFSLPYDYSLCNALARHGCSMTLAHSEFHYAAWNLSAEFVRWKHFYRRTQRPSAHSTGSQFWKLAKGVEHAVDMRAFANEVEQLRPNVIHFQWLPVPLVDRVFLPRLSRTANLVLTLHNTAGFHGSWLSRWHQGAGVSKVFRYFSAVIVHTSFSKRIVLDRGWVSADKVHVVPHGVLDYYRDLPAEKTSNKQQEKVVLFFGRIEPCKGLDVLLKAFALLPEDLRKRTRLVVAGRPSGDPSSLRMLSRSLGIEDRVTWDLRFIGEEEVGFLFRSAAAVVLPYLEVDQSGVLMTAIGLETPIVATLTGGIPETIEDGVHGRLVRPGDAPHLAEGLKEVLSDETQRENMKSALRKLRTGHLSWDYVAQRTAEIYQRVAAMTSSSHT